MIITIDGPVATGKSTVAKKVADSLGFVFFDTGALYRVLTYALEQEGIDLQEEEALANFLNQFSVDMKIQKHQRFYFYKKQDVTEAIRARPISLKVSEVATSAQVRAKINTLIKELSIGVNAVFEGRDMGTVVFPEADLKIFLNGSDEIRAKRRYEEHLMKFPEDKNHYTLEKCLQDLRQRDQFDSNRSCAPLVQAEDAISIDASDLTADEVALEILKYKDEKKIS